eukprot:COSAG04_NODE_2291_length_4379_cov_2.500234_2_plen_89_part_00
MPLAPQSQRSTAAAAVWVYIAMTVLHPVSVAAGHKVVQLPAAASRNSAAVVASGQVRGVAWLALLRGGAVSETPQLAKAFTVGMAVFV